MGWELRNGRWYVYRSARVAGRPTKQYLGRDDDSGRYAAYRLDRDRRRAAKARRLLRALHAAVRDRGERLLAAAAEADATLRATAEGLLYAVGFHRHNRGSWRMRRQLRELAQQIAALKAAADRPRPAIRIDAPAGDADAAAAFAKARAGDPAALAEVRGLLTARGWIDRLGDLGRQATRQLVNRAGGGDPVWAAAVEAKAEKLLRDLAGANPSVVEELLARRVVNGWIALHSLEIDAAVREPADRRVRDVLDRLVTRAQRRMTDAARDLARVRRLALPDLFARVAVAVPAAPPPPLGSRPPAAAVKTTGDPTDPPGPASSSD